MADAVSHQDPTRQRILDVALDLIANQGFAATTTREISERLGFTKAALYYHFRTKDDLLTALVAPAVGRLTAVVGATPARRGPTARRALVAGYVDFVADYAPTLRVLVQDPQVTKRLASLGATGVFDRLTLLLAGTDSPGTAERARVRAALGAIHNVYRRSDPDDDPAILREVALGATYAVLGVTPLRDHRPIA